MPFAMSLLLLMPCHATPLVASHEPAMPCLISLAAHLHFIDAAAMRLMMLRALR